MARSVAHCAKNGALMSGERPAGCETKFFQSSEPAGKNLMEAEKIKKSVMFGFIQSNSVKFFKSRAIPFRGLAFLAVGRIRPE
jgi:hypothetical protein